MTFQRVQQLADEARRTAQNSSTPEAEAIGKMAEALEVLASSLEAKLREINTNVRETERIARQLR